MAVTKEQFEKWLNAKEDEHIEFKEAKSDFGFDKLIGYCVALANEMGGTLILGISNAIPRVVVGTSAFQDIAKIKRDLFNTAKMRIEVEEYFYEYKRTLIFKVPSRPIGTSIHYRGRYLMRVGEELAAMTPEQLKRIFDEAQPDFSAQICNGVTLDELDFDAVEIFRKLWHKKTKNDALLSLDNIQLLKDAELFFEEGFAYAAMILLGKGGSLGRYLSNSEIVFEYRNEESSIPYQKRLEYRKGFFLIYDDLWNTINLFNEVQQIREGFIIRDIHNFNEEVVREAILNAIAHRDYRLSGSVFLRQYPNLLEIENPGGFPAGVTPENIIYKQMQESGAFWSRG